MNLPAFAADASLYRSTRTYSRAGQWTSDPSSRAITPAQVMLMPNTGGGGGRSCSSKDGGMDCYCTGGCCRTQHTCTCCGSGLSGSEIGGVIA